MLAKGGDTQALPRRPWPARWVSANQTAMPWAGAGWAMAGRWVESVSNTTCRSAICACIAGSSKSRMRAASSNGVGIVKA